MRNNRMKKRCEDLKEKEYRNGYLAAVIDYRRPTDYGWIEMVASKCTTLTVGIPDAWTIARIFGDSWEYSEEEAKQFLQASFGEKHIEVIILSQEKLSYKAVYELVHFDVFFYGAEYGILFEKDKKFFEENKVEMISMIPERRIAIAGGGALRLALEDLQHHQNIVLFGTGVYFEAYMREYGEKYRPIFAIDNDESKWNTEKQGVLIKNPSALKAESEKDTLIVICSREYQEMLAQLRALGNYNYRTLLFFNDIALIEEFAIASAEEQAYLKKAHRILTDLVGEFDRVCRNNGLHYYLICGSLIGAVRHHNHIPWDDDIDVAMPRADYKKLKKLARKEWGRNNEVYHFLDYDELGGGAFLDCMPRLYNMKEHIPTKCAEKVYGKATADIANRAFVDIYVLDNAHPNEKIHSFVTNIAMKGIYNLMMGHRAFVDYDEYRDVISEEIIRKMKKVHQIGKMLPLKFLKFWYDAFARSANLNKNCPDYIMSSCAIRCIELKYSKKSYGEGLRVPFANIEVMIPSDYDTQLHDMRYRNYMEFPRMSVRKPSHYFNSDIEIW